MVTLIIKPINTPALIKQVAGVEAETWGMDLGDTVPDHVLTAISKDGGVLLGAYDGDQLIGFTLGWLGTIDQQDGIPAANHLKLISHMTGVLAEFRDQRIGYQLKLAQREWALARGLDLITWTYDPLESRNAYLNIYLLGCTCQTYFRDYYGEMSDDMNQGIASDRFRVDWWITNYQVKNRLAEDKDSLWGHEAFEGLLQSGALLLNPASHNQENLPIPPEMTGIPNHNQLLVEIPPDFQSIRLKDPDLAVAWRCHSRDIFEDLFANGYQVIDLIYLRQDHPRSYYHLEKVIR
jgi:predicted GNAT superfamily acetyltransferase